MPVAAADHRAADVMLSQDCNRIMAETVESSREMFFFGFGKFFGFAKVGEASVELPKQPEKNNGEDAITCSRPTRIKFEGDENIAESCITWSTMFQLFKRSGEVKICGWGEGRVISAKENKLLQLNEKIVRLRGSWDKLVMISEQGSCQVMWNVQDEWIMHCVTARSRETNEAGFQDMFSLCDAGNMHCIVGDKRGKVFQVEENKVGMGLPKFICTEIPLAIVVDEVTCGKEHVLLLNKEHGTVYSFGLGSRGQLGLGQVEPEKCPKLIEALAGIRIKQIAAGGWHSLALSEFGDVYAWGWNDCGQLGIACLPPEVPLSFYMLPYIVEFPDERVVVSIACGARHSGAVTSEANVWTWGWGFYGQLGHGDTQDRKTPTIVEYFREIKSPASSITCGPWQTLIYTKRVVKP